MKRNICGKIVDLRVLLLLIGLIITCFFIYQIMKIRVYDDPLKWPPKDHTNVLVNNEIQELFGGANVVTVQLTVKGGDIFDPKVLHKIKRITDGILLMDGVVPSYVTSLSAQKVKYMKGEADLLTIEPLMERVPETEAGIERLKYGVFHSPLLYGPIVSIDTKSVIIIADFRTGDRKPGEPEYFRTTPLEIYKGITEITEPENDSNTIVRCAGSPIIIGWVNSEGIPYVILAFLCFLVVMCVVLYFIFREWRGVVLPILLGIFTSVWAFGLYATLIGKVFGSASCLLVPFILMASATCHAVQFLRRFKTEEYPQAKESTLGIVNTFDGLFVPMIVALITDIIAFAVLWIVPFTNVSIIGQIGALGLVSLVIIFVFFFIPLLSFFPGPLRENALQPSETEDNGKHTAWLEKAASLLIAPKVKWVVVAVTVVLIIPSVIVISRIDPGQDNTYAIHNYLTKSWKNNPIFLMEMNIKEKFKGVYACNLIIEAKEPDGLKAIPVLKAMDNFANDVMKKLPEVAGVLHLPVFMKLMHRFMNEEKEEYFVVPDNPLAIGDYFYMYTAGEAGAFDSVVDAAYQRAPIAIYVDSTSHETVRKILTTVNDLANKHFGNLDVKVGIAGGAIGIAGAFNDSIKKWIVLSLLFSIVASMATILIIFRSLLASIFLLISPIVAVIFTFALLHISGIEINSNIAIVASMGIGVGIDAAVYLLFRFREEFRSKKDFETSLIRTFLTAGKANMASYLALVLGCWSVIPVPLYLGYTGYGMGMVLFLNLVITLSTIVSLWAIFRPRFLFAK